MIIQFVKFKSGLSEDEVQRVMEERAPRFRALPGLIQKYYGLVKLTRFRGHLILATERVLTFPRKPDSFELEVGRFLGLP